MEKEKIERANSILRQINAVSATIEFNRERKTNLTTHGENQEIGKVISVILMRRYEQMKQFVFADLGDLKEKLELELTEL